MSVVVHDQRQAEDAGRMTMAAIDHESIDPPKLILYIDTPLEASAKRRRAMVDW